MREYPGPVFFLFFFLNQIEKYSSSRLVNVIIKKTNIKPTKRMQIIKQAGLDSGGLLNDFLTSKYCCNISVKRYESVKLLGVCIWIWI